MAGINVSPGHGMAGRQPDAGAPARRDPGLFSRIFLARPVGTHDQRRGGLAANSEPRTHMRPRASCQSCSLACRCPSARATVRKS